MGSQEDFQRIVVSAPDGQVEATCDLSDDTTLRAAEAIEKASQQGYGDLEMLDIVIGSDAVNSLIELGVDEDGMATLYASVAMMVQMRRMLIVRMVSEEVRNGS